METLADFECIRIVNLAHRTDRRAEIAAQLARVGLGFDRPNVRLFNAVRPEEPGGFESVGARGCFMSHLQVLREARELSNVLILEDDLDFVPDIGDLLRPALAALPSYWDIFYGGCLIDLPRGEGPLTRVSPLTPLRTSHFVAVNGAVIGRLVEYLEAILERPPGHINGGPMHIDGAYSRFRADNPGIAVFAAIPELGYQRPSRTDIHELKWFDRTPLVRDLVQVVRRRRARVRARHHDGRGVERGEGMLARLLHYFSVLGPKGLLGSLAGKVAGRPLVISLQRNELAHPLLIRVPSSDADVYRQIFLESQYQFEVTQSPSVIIDAGANIGLASVYFANRFPSATVIAIECEKSNFDLLQLNAASYRNIFPIHAALWNQEGELQVVDPGLGHWGFITVSGPPSAGASSVRAVTLRSVMKEHRISHIDILKIDIEGAELEVFDASSEWILDVDTVIVELHDRLKIGCEQSFAKATFEFPYRWRRGENVYVSREASCVIRATEASQV